MMTNSVSRRSFTKGAALAPAAALLAAPAKAEPKDLIAVVRDAADEMAAEIAATRWQMIVGPNHGDVRFYREVAGIEHTIAEARF